MERLTRQPKTIEGFNIIFDVLKILSRPLVERVKRWKEYQFKQEMGKRRILE